MMRSTFEAGLGRGGNPITELKGSVAAEDHKFSKASRSERKMGCVNSADEQHEGAVEVGDMIDQIVSSNQGENVEFVSYYIS